MKKINVKDMGKKFLVGLGLSAFMLGIGGVTYADSLKERQAKEIEQRLVLNQASKNGMYNFWCWYLKVLTPFFTFYKK